MSVVSSRKLFESMGGDATLTISQGSIKIVRTYQESYRVEVDSVEDGPYVVGSAAAGPHPVPLLGQPHFEDSSATCRKITPKRQADAKLAWLVTVDYSTETPDPEEEEENPLLRPVIRNKRSNQVDEPLIIDLDGEMILNTAGCQPTTPVLVKRGYGIYQFTKNYSTFNDTFADALEDSINSQPFLGKDAGTIRCNSVEAGEKFEGDYHFWEVNLEFEYNPHGWQPTMLNDGLHEIADIGFGDELVRILDAHGEPVSEPVPLDINGARIAATALPGAAITREWKGYEEYDFNQLNLNWN